LEVLLLSPKLTGCCTLWLALTGFNKTEGPVPELGAAQMGICLNCSHLQKELDTQGESGHGIEGDSFAVSSEPSGDAGQPVHNLCDL
jgi:hypothetical protein